MRLVGDLLELLYPERCAACDRAPPEAGPFCAACATALAPIASPRCTVCGEPFAEAGADHPCARCIVRTPPFARARAPFVYGGPLADAIRRMKYANRPDLAARLAPLLLREAAGLEGDLVVPVPLSTRRLFSRGFNQAALLAGFVARAMRLPFDTGSLSRVRDAPPQAGRARTVRLRSVQAAFEVARRRRPRVEDRRVILVDDVLTTGATASAATRALIRAGARVVSILTLARAGEPV